MNRADIEFIKFLRRYKEKQSKTQYSIIDNNHQTAENKILRQILYRGDDGSHCFYPRDLCPNVKLQEIIAENLKSLYEK
jgi:hypothetical protein